MRLVEVDTLRRIGVLNHEFNQYAIHARIGLIEVTARLQLDAEDMCTFRERPREVVDRRSECRSSLLPGKVIRRPDIELHPALIDIHTLFERVKRLRRYHLISDRRQARILWQQDRVNLACNRTLK